MAVNESVYFGFARTKGDASRVDSHSPGVPALLLPTQARDLHVASAADADTDWNVANPTHPTLYLHSETTPATNYGSLSHDATNFVISAGAGEISFASAVLASSALGVADDISIELGTSDDSVLRHRSTTLAANTALTDVLVGTPVAAALAANSLMISNVTDSGDIALYVNTGGATSEQAIFVDASAKNLALGQTGWAVNVLEGAVKLTLGTVSAFGTTQPTNTLVMRSGTAPAGTITTAGGIYSSATVLRKIIAAGTDTAIET